MTDQDFYSFTLILEGADILTDEAQDALFEAGCDDATFGAVSGVQVAEFDRDRREYASYGQALLRAMVQLREAVPDVRIKRVAHSELVTLADIAKRLDLSNEYVRLLAAGRRKNDFPPPVANLDDRSKLYEWRDVQLWATEHLDRADDDGIQATLVNEAINANITLFDVLPLIEETDEPTAKEIRRLLRARQLPAAAGTPGDRSRPGM